MYSLYNFLIDQEGKTAQLIRFFVSTVCAVLMSCGEVEVVCFYPPPYIVNISALTFLANSRAAMRSFMVFFTIPAICLT